MTFRDELEKILAEFIGYPKEDDITGGFNQALTSIINLVDKGVIAPDEVVPERKDWTGVWEGKTRHYNNSVERIELMHRNQLRAEQRIKLKEK